MSEPDTKTSKERRKGTDATRALRPAVQCNLGSQMLLGQERQAVKEAAGKCQLLLIIGISLKDPDILDLTRELGEVIRSNYGGVVYCDSRALRGGQSTHDHIDFHLRVEPEVVIEGMLSALDKVNNEGMQVDGEDHTADMWFDIINNEIPRVSCPEEPEYMEPRCSYCNCDVLEYLIPCTKCHLLFCYRRTEYLAELSANTAQSHPEEPKAEANDNEFDPFEFDLACFVFDRFARGGSSRTLESIKASFECPDCWDFPSAGLYPHFVRAMPRLTVERLGEPSPRLVLLVYYLEQFWPAANQLCALLSGRWKSNGWPCHIIPIKLECLAEHQKGIDDLAWEEKSFDAMVVYLTHGLTGEQGYQVGHQTALRAAQFFDQTLQVAQALLSKARVRRGFLICCGHPLFSPPMVSEMQVWIDRNNSPSQLDSIVGCLNRRMSPGYIVNLISKLSTRLVEQDDWAREVMFETWLTDSIARTHSDLLHLAPGRSAEMWLYAPFQSRPLGKPLPGFTAHLQVP
ncbi:hypothetical protein RSOL_299290, partial [Rhizoctonia solani AG-3 Rhs1AP]